MQRPDFVDCVDKSSSDLIETSQSLKNSLAFQSSILTCGKISRTLPSRLKLDSSFKPRASVIGMECVATPGFQSDKSPQNSPDSGRDERFPTYVIPNEKPTVINKTPLVLLPIPKSPIDQFYVDRHFAFNPTNTPNSSPKVQSIPVHMQIDWGDDNKWILLFDNLLKSSTSASYKRQQNSDCHGKLQP